MKKVVKISEKKLINFIKKSLNEYNNKIINKTNIVLNEQNNDWKKVPNQTFFDKLNEKGGYEFKRGFSLNSAVKAMSFTESSTIHTYWRKKSEDEVIDDPNEDGSELSRWLGMIKGGEENKMDDVAKKAWEAVKIYANANNIKRQTMFSENNKNVWQYYTIKGIDFYDDGYKVTNPAKPEEQERYSEDDEALTIENKPLVTVVPDNKPETKVTNEPLKPTPTPTKKIISTNNDNF